MRKYLFELRKNKNKTQQEVALRIGITRAYYQLKLGQDKREWILCCLRKWLTTLVYLWRKLFAWRKDFAPLKKEARRNRKSLGQGNRA